MSKYKEAVDVLKGEYSADTKMKYGGCVIMQGRVEVIVVQEQQKTESYT